MNLLSAVHQLAWTQHPAIWLCESCGILWLMLRAVRSPWVRAGVLLVLCGLMLNGMVTTANAGTMPVVGMPSRVHPVSPMWRAATSETRLPFLADQARLGMFSVGDLVMLFGGILIVAIFLHRSASKVNPATPFQAGLSPAARWPIRPRAKVHFDAAFRPRFRRFGCWPTGIVFETP